MTSPKFQAKILNLVRKIPKGRVAAYKTIAESAGKPKAFRAVGNILNKNKKLAVPCHRVIKSSGSIGGYQKGSQAKIKILRKEGVKIKNGKINSEKYFYKF